MAVQEFGVLSTPFISILSYRSLYLSVFLYFQTLYTEMIGLVGEYIVNMMMINKLMIVHLSNPRSDEGEQIKLFHIQ